MFIGETHDDMMHLQRLLMTWPVLCREIDVLFLEHFDAGEIPPWSSVQAMREALAGVTGLSARRWARSRRLKRSIAGTNYMLPDHLHQLAQAARRTGTPLRGIDVMKKIHQQELDEYLETRLGELTHETWDRALTENLNQLFGTTVGKRYAIYGGVLHGPRLQKRIPELISYTLDKNLQYRQYDECPVGPDGSPLVLWVI